jgi:hypothetical protein
MNVFHFISTDCQVEITATTAADMTANWVRFRSRVDTDKAMSYCDYRSTLQGTLQLLNPSDKMLSQVGEPDVNTWLGLPPVFYETATYNVSIRLTNVENEPIILHKLKEVTELFTLVKLNEKDWLLTAPLSFLNEPGIFELTFKYKPMDKPERVDTFSFRVVSPKLDTKDDYNHILADINEQYNEIVFQYLTLTLQNLQRGGRSDNDVVWLSIFRQIVKPYIKAITYIVNRPHLRQTSEVRFSRADRIKIWSPQMAERYANAKVDNRLDTEYFRHENTINTHNTRENKFVKFTIDRIGRRLSSVVQKIKSKNAKAKDSDKISDTELAELDDYVLALNKLGNSSLLRGLRGEPLHSESMVLQKRTGYAQVYRDWLLLQKGIELFEGSNAIGVRPIWELYELWCFLKMRKMVANILGLDFTNQEEITEKPMPMVKPFEDNNQEHTVYYNCPDGSHARLHYQHTYSRRTGEIHTATTENRPDIVLSIIRPDGFELTYLFDAKYRLLDDNRLNTEDREELAAAQGADTPPADAINQMHRYRDAIYYGEHQTPSFAKEIIGGYILFPGRGDNDSIKKRYFYKSIEEVNIGAFPLLPNASDPNSEGTLLYEFLHKILTEPTAYEHIKDSVPQKGLAYHSVTDVVPSDLVLVGYYKNSEQLDLIFKNKIYYVPAALGKGSINLVSGFEKTKYLLLHHEENRMLLELTGDGPKFFPKTALEGMGFHPHGDFYLGFSLKSESIIENIDVSHYRLEKYARNQYTPYFTTMENIKTTKE